ncbi:MAG: hypothetical protein M1830_005217 [Pleopsidium flavum]|nr:MAG: hypothetical protein M1830_005217 [Pleopsidium flavum]
MVKKVSWNAENDRKVYALQTSRHMPSKVSYSEDKAYRSKKGQRLTKIFQLLLQLMPRDTKEVNMQALAGMYDELPIHFIINESAPLPLLPILRNQLPSQRAPTLSNQHPLHRLRPPTNPLPTLGATPKAIEERIAKLKREKKSTDPATLVSTSSPSSSTPTVQSKPRKPATKSATTDDDIGIGPAASPGGRKRGRAPTKTEERARKKGEIFGVGDDEEMEGIKKEEVDEDAEGGKGEGGVKGEMVEDEISDVDDEGKGKAAKRAKVDATDRDGKDTDAEKGEGKATADIEDEPEEMVYVIAEDEDGKVGFKVEAKKEGKTKVEEGK